MSITIGVVNRAPVAEDLSLEVREDYAPLSVNLRGTDADGDYVRYIVVEEPAHGRIYGNLPNLTYRPDKDYNGQDKLTYRVTDRKDDSNLATVSITVTPSNDSPVLIGLSNSTVPENQPAGTLVGVLSATDVDGDTLTYTLSGSSGNYNFIIEGDQLKTARPFDYESGESLGVRIKVEDEVGSWDDDGFSITVTDEVGETHVVTSAADNGAGSLRQTVADVKSDDTISFDPNLSGQTITLTGGPITITEDIIVSGPSQNNLSIDGNGESQLFVIEPSARVTLENLTLTNGYGEQGGAIHNRGNLTLQGDLRITNSVAHEGGGVFSTSSLTLRDSVTIANNSAESGGGIRSGGGLRMWGNASVTSNAAQVEGGGVYSQGYVGLHEYASVTNNQADDAGGVYSGGSTALYDYATIAGNTARGIGGGVMQIALFDSLKLRDNSSISGNTAGNGGGVFYILGGVFSIRGDAHISNNTALRGPGGGVYLYEETETEGIIEGDTVLNNAPDDIYRDSD